MDQGKITKVIDQFFNSLKSVDNKTLEVNGEHYTADHILIAVGGRPTIPNIPGAELGIDSNGFFELKEQPKRVAVVGAGYIAVELAGVAKAFCFKLPFLDCNSSQRKALRSILIALESETLFSSSSE